MRIALLCADRGVPLGGVKGASVHLRSFAGALMRRDHTVSIVVANPQQDECVRPLVDAGVVVRPLRVGADSGEQSWMRELDWHLASLRPDLVVERLSLEAPFGARAAAAAGIRHVYEVNAPLDREAAAHRGLVDVAGATARIAEGFKHSRGAIAVSDEVAAWIRELAPPSFPVEVVPNGAGPEFFEPVSSVATVRVAGVVGYSPAEFRVGFVGSFRPWHDLDTLLDAAALAAARTRIRLVLVGDGPRRNELLRRAWQTGLPLTLAGRMPHADIPAAMALMNAVAVPYRQENVYFSPLKLYEAMAAGRPIVASATAPVRRAIRHGVEGLLVPPGDPIALADALLSLASDPALAARLGIAARAAAAAHHTWDSVADRVIGFAATLDARERASCEG